MEKEKMDRISELTRLSRERELTEDEKTERAALRAEYLKDWRESTINVLENTPTSWTKRATSESSARSEKDPAGHAGDGGAAGALLFQLSSNMPW